MILFALSAVLAVHPASAIVACIYTSLTPAERATMGQEILARQHASDATVTAQVRAADVCAHGHRLSPDRVLHAMGAATMHAAADSAGQRIGDPEWVPIADRAVRARSAAQRQALASRNDSETEFAPLLAAMLKEDKGIAVGLETSADAPQNVVLMVKLPALGAAEEGEADAS